MIELENIKYELVANYKEAFVKEEFESLWTDYFKDYDYVVGDYSYNKLRLKGFYDSSNKKVKDINNFVNLEKYLSNNCAYECRYFVLKRTELKCKFSEIKKNQVIE